MAKVNGERLPQVDAPFRFGRTAIAPAAPTSAAPPADPATSHRLIRGSSRHDDRLATTSRASDRAPAATHAQADPGSAAGRCSAVSAPSPRAMSRAPRARPNTRAARSSAAAPTHGRAGTEGQARAVSPSATRPAATALAPRRSSAAIAVELTCACPSSVPVRASPGPGASSLRRRGPDTEPGLVAQPHMQTQIVRRQPARRCSVTGGISLTTAGSPTLVRGRKVPLRFWVRAEQPVMCDRLGLGVLVLGPAAMFAVLMVLAVTTIAGALRSDIHGSGRRHRRGRFSRPRR